MDDLIEAGRRLRSYHVEPTPDVSEIYRRSERRRRRAAGGVAAAVVTAVAGIVIALILTVSSHPQNATVGSNGNPAAPAGRGLAVVTVTLHVTKVPAGVSIQGVATVDNNIGKPIPEPDPACSLWIYVGLTGHTTSSTPNNDAQLCNLVDKVPDGISRYPITVQTTYDRCSQIPSQATPDTPACLGPNRNMLPPLPAGTYRTVISVPPPLKAGNSVIVQLTNSRT